MFSGTALLLVGGGLYGLYTLTSRPDDLVAVIFGFVLIGVGRTIVNRTTPDRFRQFLLSAFTAAFIIRALGSIAYYQIGVPGQLWDPDALGGFRLANRLYEGWLGPGPGLSGERLESTYGTIVNYSKIGAGLFYLLGQSSHLSLGFLSCFAGAIVPVVIYHLGRDLFSERALKFAVLCISFFPSLILWSCQSLKEPLVHLAECLMVLGLVHLRTRRLITQIAFVLFGLILLYYLRRYIFYCGVVVALWSIALMFPNERMMRRVLITAGIVVPILIVMVRPGLIMQRLILPSLGAAQEFREEITTGRFGTGSSTTLGANVRSPAGALRALPISMVYFLLAPFPHHLITTGSFRMLFSLPEMIVWWCIVPLAFSGAIDMWRRARSGIPGDEARTRFRRLEPVFLFVFILFVVYSLIFGNIGLAYRHRAQIAFYMFLFAGYALDLRRERASFAVPELRSVPA